MRVSLKIALSLLITVVIFAATTVLAFSGLFDLLETDFYQPRVQSRYQASVAELADQVDEFHRLNVRRYSAGLDQPYIGTAFLANQSREHIVSRQQAFDRLHAERPNLLFVRFFGPEAGRLHFSTLATDLIRDEQFVRVYASVRELGDAPSLGAMADRQTPIRVTLDADRQRFVYAFAVVDELDVYRGAALYYVAARELSDHLLRLSGTGFRDLALVAGRGLLINPPPPAQRFVAAAAEAWARMEPGVSPAPVLSLAAESEPARVSATAPGSGSAEGDAPATAGAPGNGAEEDGSFANSTAGTDRFLLFTAVTENGLVGLIVARSQFVIPTPMRWILLAAAGSTVFLLVFLLLNLRQDPLVVLAERIKRFQVGFLRELIENKENLEWDRWQRELQYRKAEVRKRLARGIGGVPRGREQEVDALFDKSWDEIIAVLGQRAEQSREHVDVARLEQLIRNALAGGVAGAGAAAAAALPGPATAQMASAPAAPAPGLPAQTEPAAASAEAVEELEDAEPVEELSAADAVESVEELVEPVEELVEELAEPVEELAEPVEELAEPVEELAEPVEAVAELGEELAEPIAELAELVEAPAADTADEVAEQGEVPAEPAATAAVPPAAQDAAAGVEELAELEEAGSLEELGAPGSDATEELAEIEAVEPVAGLAPAAEALDLDDPELAAAAEELTAVTPSPPLPQDTSEAAGELVADLEEVEEVEELETLEELAEGDETEAAASAAAAAEPVEELEVFDSLAPLPPAAELESLEELDEVDEAESVTPDAALAGSAAAAAGAGNGVSLEPLFDRLEREDKLVVIEHSNFIDAVAAARDAVALEHDGVYRIKEEVYASAPESASAAVAAAARELAPPPGRRSLKRLAEAIAQRRRGSAEPPDTGVSGVGDLFETVADLSTFTSDAGGDPTRAETASFGRRQHRRMPIAEAGLMFDDLLSQYPRPDSETTQVRALVDVSRPLDAVGAVMLAATDDNGYRPEFSIGLMDQSVARLAFTAGDLIYDRFLAARRLLIIREELASLGAFATGFSKEDVELIHCLSFVPAHLRGRDAYLVFASRDAGAAWDAEYLMTKLNIYPARTE